MERNVGKIRWVQNLLKHLGHLSIILFINVYYSCSWIGKDYNAQSEF
ncbi:MULTISPECIES: hypothetical protein [Thermococcus]